MSWQDAVVMVAQLACLIALIPTLRDRARWPHRTTCLVTGLALASMTIAFASLSFWLATATTGLSAMVWMRMSVRTHVTGNFVPETIHVSGTPPAPRKK